MNNYEEMDRDEAVQRLMAVEEICESNLINGRMMLTATFDLLTKILSLASGEDSESKLSEPRDLPLDHVIISCDASITKNPGGKVGVGAVIQFKNEPEVDVYRVMPKSETNNEGEYDAVYVALMQLSSLKNNPGCEVEVRSDSKLVVDQLNGKMACNKDRLKKRRDAILELALTLPVPVSFQWRPRNSTPALERADYLARQALGLKDR